MSTKVFMVLVSTLVIGGIMNSGVVKADNSTFKIEDRKKEINIRPELLDKKYESGEINLQEYEEGKMMINRLDEMGILKKSNSKSGGRCVGFDPK